MPYPTNNPYLVVNEDLIARTRASLETDLVNTVRVLISRGEGGIGFMARWLDSTQECLGKFPEFGFGVRKMDPNIFPQLVEALVPLKRAGLEKEAGEIMIKVLSECGVPREAFKNL